MRHFDAYLHTSLSSLSSHPSLSHDASVSLFLSSQVYSSFQVPDEDTGHPKQKKENARHLAQGERITAMMPI